MAGPRAAVEEGRSKQALKTIVRSWGFMLRDCEQKSDLHDLMYSLVR